MIRGNFKPYRDKLVLAIGFGLVALAVSWLGLAYLCLDQSSPVTGNLADAVTEIAWRLLGTVVGAIAAGTILYSLVKVPLERERRTERLLDSFVRPLTAPEEHRRRGVLVHAIREYLDEGSDVVTTTFESFLQCRPAGRACHEQLMHIRMVLEDFSELTGTYDQFSTLPSSQPREWILSFWLYWYLILQALGSIGPLEARSGFPVTGRVVERFKGNGYHLLGFDGAKGPRKNKFPFSSWLDRVVPPGEGLVLVD